MVTSMECLLTLLAWKRSFPGVSPHAGLKDKNNFATQWTRPPLLVKLLSPVLSAFVVLFDVVVSSSCDKLYY